MLKQAHLHPAFAPRDAVKLCCQASFGASHILKDESRALEYLTEELSACEPCQEEPLYEPISPMLCRVNLRSWKARGFTASELFSLFLASVLPEEGKKECLAAAFSAVGNLCAENLLPFSLTDWERERDAFLQSGADSVHHSDIYRERENPAYRLAPTEKVVQFVSSLL